MYFKHHALAKNWYHRRGGARASGQVSRRMRPREARHESRSRKRRLSTSPPQKHSDLPRTEYITLKNNCIYTFRIRVDPVQKRLLRSLIRVDVPPCYPDGRYLYDLSWSAGNCDRWMYDPNRSGIYIYGVRSRNPFSRSKSTSGGELSLPRSGPWPVTAVGPRTRPETGQCPVPSPLGRS